MAKLLKLGFQRLVWSPGLSMSTANLGSSLSQQEIAAVLRPLYFAVHPDLFYQFPKEKEINENSLKQLNFYLETVLKNAPTNPVSVTFCLRKTSQKVDSNMSFKQVNVQLLGKDIHRVLHSILSSCHLSTEYLDTLRRPKQHAAKVRHVDQSRPSKQPDPFHATWWREAEKMAEDIEQRIRNEPDIDLRSWLSENIAVASERLGRGLPLRQETERLRLELKRALQLQELAWDCGWGAPHARGALLSFQQLTTQYPKDVQSLRGRTVVFGRQTGISFEGHIILSSEDVRSNWLEMIRSMSQYDVLLTQIPDAENSLSEVLRGIKICHRKFQPTVMVEKYVQQLGKLISALYKHRWVHGYPLDWPRRFDKFQLVVECEAGPLMLSPTGQFIVPASCPAFLLVDFISHNLDEATRLLQLYNAMKVEEVKVRSLCISRLGLASLEKDDNITPDIMTECCGRLLSCGYFSLQGLRLRVSHYYCVLQDGEICIPWDWKER